MRQNAVMICIFYNYVSSNLLNVLLRDVSIVIKTDVKTFKRYSIIIWKQGKDLKSIEENTKYNKID
jgi:hypothetical protein